MRTANLILPIERDIRAYIFFVGGEPSQDGIKKLIEHLNLSLDAYQEQPAPVSSKEEEEPLAH